MISWIIILSSCVAGQSRENTSLYCFESLWDILYKYLRVTLILALGVMLNNFTFKEQVFLPCWIWPFLVCFIFVWLCLVWFGYRIIRLQMMPFWYPLYFGELSFPHPTTLSYQRLHGFVSIDYNFEAEGLYLIKYINKIYLFIYFIYLYIFLLNISIRYILPRDYRNVNFQIIFGS